MIIKPADIMVIGGNEPVSWGIQVATRGWVSHSQIVWDWPMVISADAEGVVLRKVHDSELKKHAILRYPGLTDSQATSILTFCHGQVGVGYDYLGLLLFGVAQDPNRWYCSELIHAGYQRGGVNLIVRSGFVEPRDFWVSPLLGVVERVNV